MATSDSVLTYDEVSRCPSLWTPDHWMNAISPIPAICYDEAIRCPGWTLDATESGVPTPWRWHQLGPKVNWPKVIEMRGASSSFGWVVCFVVFFLSVL